LALAQFADAATAGSQSAVQASGVRVFPLPQHGRAWLKLSLPASAWTLWNTTKLRTRWNGVGARYVVALDVEQARHCILSQNALRRRILMSPADTPKRDIKSIAVIGTGTMGGGIAMNFHRPPGQDAGDETKRGRGLKPRSGKTGLRSKGKLGRPVRRRMALLSFYG
jgi:hypothetical protein